jgi:subtilisin family serine protease
MLKPEQIIRVEIRFSDAEELNSIQKELSFSAAKIFGIYDGVIDAEIPVAAVEYLRKNKILIDFPINQQVDETGKPQLTAEESINETIQLNEEKEWLSKFKKRGKRVKINTQTNQYSVQSEAEQPAEEKNFEPLSEETGGNLEVIVLPQKDEAAGVEPGIKEEALYIIQLNGPLNQEWRNALAEKDISLTASRDSQRRNTFTACLNKVQYEALLSMGITRSVTEYQIEKKISLSLEKNLEETVHLPENTGSGSKTFEIALTSKKYLDKILTVINNSGEAQVIDAGQNIVRIQTDVQAPLLAGLVDLPYVQSVAVYEPPHLFCDVVRTTIGIDPTGQGNNYSGKGEIVAVIDSGIDATHPDLVHQIKKSMKYGSGSANDVVGHGTHVSGIICGDGTASQGKIKGIAPGSKIISVGIVKNDMRLDLPADLGKLLEIAEAEGAKIINLSWGTALSGEYQHGSFSIDQYIYDHPDILVVVAAGNEGEAVNGKLAYRTIGVPASAKNVLTVGAATTRRTNPVIKETWGIRNPGKFPQPPMNNQRLAMPVDQPSASSSRGPTDFYSIKPEVLAPGNYILAAKAAVININQASPEYFNNSYVFKTGTSMAAPVVSGTAALVREYLVKEHNNNNPSAALLKAIIIGCSHEVQNTRTPPGDDSLNNIGFPDFDQGFGLVDVKNLLTDKTIQLHYADIKNSDPKALVSRATWGGPVKSFREYKLDITDSSQELTFVLCWLDPPARGVQNNLQLSVKIPGNDWLNGNEKHKYMHDPLVDALNQFNLKPFDNKNTVEKVVIQNPPAGTYVIRVSAQSTVDKAQGYALVVLGRIVNFDER